MKKEQPISHSKLYTKLNTVRKHLNDRCNNPNSKDYKYYGGRGVTYDPKWATFEGFLEDADSIEGWDEELFLKGKLQLDKDLKIEGNTIYSKDTCMWVHPDINKGMRPTFMRPVIAISPYGERFRFFNKTNFEKSHNLTVEGMNNVLKGNQKAHKYWQFRYEDELEDFPFYPDKEVLPEKVKVKTRFLEHLVYINYQECADDLTKRYGERIYSCNVSSVARGIRKHCKGHVIMSFYNQDNFPNDLDMPERLRYKDILVTSPNGDKKVYSYKDRPVMYKTTGVDNRRVLEYLNKNKRASSSSLKGFNFEYVD